MAQVEITSPSPVLDETGHSINSGWARAPLFVYDTELVWASRFRMSSADRYAVFSPTYTFVFEVFDGGVLGYTRIIVLSLRDKRIFEHTVTTPLPLGSYNLPPSSASGAIHRRPQKDIVDFVVLKPGVRIIRIDIPVFGKRRSLRGELVLRKPDGAQSIVTNTTWTGHRNRFAITRVSPWFLAEGVMQFDSTDIVFSGGHGLGVYYWYRALRPKADEHLWAAACGVQDGRLLGVSAGYGPRHGYDAKSGTENAFFVDGRLHKLNQITFHIPTGRLAPWRFTSDDGRLEMTFAPQQETSFQTLMFFSARSVRQVYGLFSGTVVLDDGKILEFANLSGLTERRRTNF